MPMQIEIYTPTQGQPLPPVEWNYAEVKKWIEDGLEAYKGRVYTEETVVLAKKDRATLNKLVDAIDTKRKEMKRCYLAPYENFEVQTKELVAIVKEQAAVIDAQIKAFEDFRRQEKLELIKAEVYAPMIGDLAALVPYDRLHDPKWLNVTVSMSAVSEDMGGKINRIESGLDAIDKLEMDEAMAEQVKGVFLRGFDLAAALAEKERIEKRREELACYKAAQEAAQEARQLTAPPAEKTPTAQETAESTPIASPAPDERLYTVAFKVEATAAQLDALKAFLKNNNIRYGRA